MRFLICVALGLCAVFPVYAETAAPAWEKTVTSSERGALPNPRPPPANDPLGWNDVLAATA